jgi:8-oxo-dGTP pyrophosphatase MutT (NUDIX family)
MAKDVYQVSVKAVIVRPDGKVLGLNGKIGGIFEGYYDLPGGRIETDEVSTPLADIIRREIKEETGLTDVEIEEQPISLGRQLLKTLDTSNNPVRVLYVFFSAHVTETESVEISDEHEGFAWLDLNEENLETYFKSGMLEGMRGYLANK